MADGQCADRSDYGPAMMDGRLGRERERERKKWRDEREWASQRVEIATLHLVMKSNAFVGAGGGGGGGGGGTHLWRGDKYTDADGDELQGERGLVGNEGSDWEQ